MELLLKLLLAHLLGDFVLQPKGWIEKKETRKLFAWQFYAHVLIHGFLTMLLVADLDFLVPAILLMISHGLIDATKIFLQNQQTKRTWFLADQVLHVMMIVVIWLLVDQPEWNLEMFQSTTFLFTLTIFVFITSPASIMIKHIISRWTPQSNSSKIASLENAGNYIGILERILIVIFIMLDHWEGAGFLLAAKSIFRFGDLRQNSDLKLTEYVLIGTLLSFGIAVSAGIFVQAVRA